MIGLKSFGTYLKGVLDEAGHTVDQAASLIHVDSEDLRAFVEGRRCLRDDDVSRLASSLGRPKIAVTWLQLSRLSDKAKKMRPVIGKRASVVDHIGFSLPMCATWCPNFVPGQGGHYCDIFGSHVGPVCEPAVWVAQEIVEAACNTDVHYDLLESMIVDYGDAIGVLPRKRFLGVDIARPGSERTVVTNVPLESHFGFDGRDPE